MTRLHLDLSAPTSPVDPARWFGGDVGPASMLLRKDVRRHLLMCRDELGFRHVRCQGILGPEMAADRPDGSFDFDRVESALDWMMENGLVPYFSLSAAAAGPDGLWHQKVRALAARVDGRYGCDAREWYFEVAADPADPEALRQYDGAARAIKEVHPEYRVGGPAARDAAALDAFLSHVGSRNEPASDVPPCDFVSTGPGAGGLTAADARRRVTAALAEHVPLIVAGGAGSEATPGDADDCNHAALVAGSAVEGLGVCHGVTFGVSDIQTGPGARFEPFYGGPGLVTVNDVPKGAFHALRLLREHAGYHCERLRSRWEEPVPGLGCLATRSEHTLRLLVWLHRGPGGGGVEGPGGGGPTRFTIEGLAESVRDAQVEVIRPGAGSAYETWERMGRPPFVNREVLDALEAGSQPALAQVDFREYPPRLEPGMVMQLTVQLPFGED